ncbi:MAG: hypothetical protein WC565_03495 [Parcubacteria group bacterium]
MSAAGENTAQKHVLWTRPLIVSSGILPDPERSHTILVPETDKEWRESKKAAETDRGWRYHRVGGGLLGFRFDQPVLWRDMDNIAYEARKNREEAEKNAFVQKYIAGAGELHNPTSVIVRNCGLLTRTTKMGCYSWNLPAGPPRFGGCCPGSAVGFDTKRMDLPRGPLDGLKVLSGIKRLRVAAAKEYVDSLPMKPGEAMERFICNGCYALKGSYGNPSIILVMQWRKMWTDYAVKNGTFIPVMKAAIRMAQDVSRRARSRTSDPNKLAVIPHPDFFRIHDSGDFFSPEYLGMWLEIVRSMKDIHFWAPTRIWTSSSGAKMIEDVVRKGKFPKNLAIRPSGIFFDAPEPSVGDMSGGTSSNTISFDIKKGKIQVQISDTGPDTWACPAYLPSVIGGGARAKIQGKKEMKDIVESGVKVKDNPAQSYPLSYPMYPTDVDIKTLPKDGVFYDAIVDVKEKRFVLDQHGRPMTASVTHLRDIRKANPGKVYAIAKTQAYEAAGCCAIAIDMNKKPECRVCWGVTGGKRDQKVVRLPVVYGKH